MYIAAGIAAASEDFASFVGSYECQSGPSFTMTDSTYDQGGSGPEVIANKLQVENGFIITLADGWKFGVWRKSEDFIEWMSAASGDTFLCNKSK